MKRGRSFCIKIFYFLQVQRSKHKINAGKSIHGMNVNGVNNRSKATSIAHGHRQKNDASLDDALCTFELRRLPTALKLNDFQCDFVHNSKQERCNKSDLLVPNKIMKFTSSGSIDGPHDTDLLKMYDSPVKPSKTTTVKYFGQNDIMVNFTEQCPHQSPRTVLINDIFSRNTNTDVQEFEEIIFGSTNEAFDDASQSVKSYAHSERQRINDKAIFSTESENTAVTDDTFIATVDNDGALSEGLVWQNLLNDLKSAYNYHRKGVVMLQEGIKKHKLNPTKINLALPNPTGKMSDQNPCHKFHTHYPANAISSRSNLSNDAVTISTYTGSSFYSMALTDESMDNDLKQHDITVVDTRPTSFTIVRRLSIFLIQNEKRWTADKDIATLFPNYLSCCPTANHSQVSSLHSASDGLVIHRDRSKSQNADDSQNTRNQNCFWRLWLRYRRVKQRLKMLL
jgi:hypothetical protein